MPAACLQRKGQFYTRNACLRACGASGANGIFSVPPAEPAGMPPFQGLRQPPGKPGEMCIRDSGVPTRANQRVAAGAAVSFELPPEADTSVIPEDIPLSIVYEDEHAMVLEKPAGMAVHPTRGEVRGTLANAFCGLLRARGQKGVFRPINRLDKGTSGLVLCAIPGSARRIFLSLG